MSPYRRTTAREDETLHELAARLSRTAVDALKETVQAERNTPLEDFAPIVRRELFELLSHEFPEVDPDWLRSILELYVTLSSQRIAIDFDSIVAHLLEPDTVAKTSPDDLV